jgi:multidrug transporter EmrE-like cation transporter
VTWIFLSIGLQLCALILLKLTASSQAYGMTGVLFHPYVFFAFFLLGGQALVWQLALRIYPLHRAYALQALIFPLALCVGVAAFGELATIAKVVGVLLIMAGVYRNQADS